MKRTQNQAILDYLKTGASLTSLEALNIFGCFRCASRISDLRKEGHDIQAETIRLPSGKHVAKYTLKTQVEASGQVVMI